MAPKKFLFRRGRKSNSLAITGKPPPQEKTAVAKEMNAPGMDGGSLGLQPKFWSALSDRPTAQPHWPTTYFVTRLAFQKVW